MTLKSRLRLYAHAAWLMIAVTVLPGTLNAQVSGAVLEEVIVTASKRAENIQDSSLIVDAFSGEQLRNAGIDNVSDLANLQPGLQVGLGGPALQVYVRGVGNPGSTAVTSPAVAVNKDGVYIARSQAATVSFYDLARVEVLKGPQGTLYGRNATGGAINLITQSPVLDENNGFISAGFGNYSLFQTEAAANVALGDSLAVRAAISVLDRDGYMSDDTSDEDKQSGRLQLLWEPSDRFSLLLAGQYSEIGGQGGGHGYVGAGDPYESILSTGANAVLAAGTAANGFIAPSIIFPWVTEPMLGPFTEGPLAGFERLGLVDQKSPGDLYQNMEFLDVSARLSWDMDFAELTIIPAYQKAEMAYVTHPGLRYETVNVLTGEPEESDASSLEVRLSKETDRLKWVAGAYLYSEDQEANVYIDHGPVQNTAILAEYETDSLGLFGELNFSVTDSTRLIAGIRYSDDDIDKKNFRRFAVNESIQCNPLLPPDNPASIQTFPSGVQACVISQSDDESASFDSTDWKVGIEHDLTEDSMVFFTVSTGYKAGGISQVAGSNFLPEELTSYELGIRNTLLDGRMQLNADVFYWDYSEHQEFLIGPDELGIVGQSIINAGDATIKGFSFDIDFATNETGILSFGAEYLSSEYDNFSFVQSGQFTAPTVQCNVTPTGVMLPTIGGPPGLVPELNIDCSGFDLVRAPEWTAFASYTQGFDLGEFGALEASVDANYTDDRWVNAAFLADDYVDGHTIINARLTYNTSNERFSVTAYVNNLSDDERILNSQTHSQVFQLVGQAVGEPRMYGLRARYQF